MMATLTRGNQVAFVARRASSIVDCTPMLVRVRYCYTMPLHSSDRHNTTATPIEQKHCGHYMLPSVLPSTLGLPAKLLWRGWPLGARTYDAFSNIFIGQFHQLTSVRAALPFFITSCARMSSKFVGKSTDLLGRPSRARFLLPSVNR